MNESLPIVLNSYSPKEIAVMDGVMKLLSEGSKLYDIKVSDIAAAAGIGKGTVYEYFESKEQIIGRTVIYKLNEGFSELKTIFDSGLPFKSTAFALLDNAAGVFSNQVPSLWSLMSSLMQKEKMPPSAQTREISLMCTHNSVTVCDMLVKLGLSEGVLREPAGSDYSHFVFNGMIASYVQHTSGCCGEPRLLDSAKDFAYEMFVKSLG